MNLKLVVILLLASAVCAQASRKRYYLDMTIAGFPAGRIVVETYDDVVPKTAANFGQICASNSRQTYKRSRIHRIIPNFMMQGGDYETGKGIGGKSIYGQKFDDENFTMRHTGPGILSMANAGPNTNGSQFFITFVKTDWLDDRHVVFGHVVEGMDVVMKVQEQGTQSGKPKTEVVIADCGRI